MALKIRPSMRVHSWGGLGSQLYALNFIFNTRAKFPNKKFVLIQHTSGFTLRRADLDFLDVPYIKIKEKDDFYKPSSSTGPKKINVKVLLKKIIKKKLSSTGVYLFDEVFEEPTKIYKRTLGIRSSYTKAIINENLLDYLIEKFTSGFKSNNYKSNSLAIHYRLGDLLELQVKPISSPDLIVEKIVQILQFNKIESVNVYSDSIDEAKDRLDFSNFDFQVNFVECSPFEVLSQCFSSDYFIGTGSKISIWVYRLREFDNKKKISHLVGHF